jgi:ferredoxin
MPRVITNLCLRDASCVEVCPVDCISPGKPVEQYPTFYIDPDTCIDCGACEVECPHSAIFEESAVPENFVADGGEVLTAPVGTSGFDDPYTGESHDGKPVLIPATRVLISRESVDLTPAIENNANFYLEGPGYSTQG